MGIAIKTHPYGERAIVAFQTLITAETLKLIDCLKCPKCGFSDDGK